MTQPASVDLLTYFAVHAPPVPEWFLNAKLHDGPEPNRPAYPGVDAPLEDREFFAGAEDVWIQGVNIIRMVRWPWWYATAVLAARPSMEVGG